MNARTTSPRSTLSLHLRHRSLAFLLACFLFACYLLTYTGLIESSDGLSMFSTTESIARRGEIDANQLLWMGLQQGSFGPDGELYSRKGVGMTLLALPLVWLALQWSALGLVQAAMLLNPLLTAWTAALVYGAAVRLGWSSFVAVVTALVYGLATLAWPYTQTFFSDPVAAWGLFGALYCILAYGQTSRKRYLFLAGTAWGIAYLARSINLVTLPVYAIALATLLWPQPRTTHYAIRNTHYVAVLQQANGGKLLNHLSTLFLPHLRQWILFGLPILLAGLISLGWNWLRYGDLLDSGYLEVESFSGDWLFGLYGLLVGPGRGLLWYSPILLLAISGVRWFWRRARWLLWIILGVSLLYLLLYAKWFMWHGGYSWGPRFLVPVLPFLALLTAPVWHWIYDRNRWDTAGKLAVLLLLILSLGVQWLGLVVPFHLVQDELAATVTPLFAPETFTQWRYSPLLRQWDYLTQQHFQFAWWQTGPDWLAFGLIVGTIFVGGWLLMRQLAGAQRGEPLPNWLYGIALLLVTLVLLVRYQLPLSGMATATVADAIAAHEDANDAILALRPAESQHFANVYHGHLPLYGLMPTEALDAEAEAQLAALASHYRRLWVLPDLSPPERSGWERALRSDAFLLSDESVEGQRLALYAFPTAQPLTETGVGVQFGEPAWVRLNGYDYTDHTHPGGELLVALEWESLRPVEANYHVFVHLLDEAGEKLAQRDGQPVLWLRPTNTWQTGERILDRYALLLDPDLPPGEYHIAVGLYDPATGVRQPVSAGTADAVKLGPIVVNGEAEE